MDSLFGTHYGGYDLEPDSDDEGIRIDGQASSDSEDEFSGDVQIRKLIEEYEKRHGPVGHTGTGNTRTKTEDDDEDDFEKEMEAELDSCVSDIERRRFQPESEDMVSDESSSQTTGTKPKDKKNVSFAKQANSADKPDSTADAPTEGASGDGFYDDVYFDTDSDSDSDNAEAHSGRKAKKKHPILSNDDLFYDPNIDDDNQKWMDEQRRKRRPKTKQKTKMAPNSDAILDCPACLTTVCIDCQRHELYEHQFRAMFVEHCTVDPEQTIHAPLQEQHRKRKHGQAPEAPSTTADDIFLAVKCSECNTVLGAMDKEEIYYFFNVLPSHT